MRARVAIVAASLVALAAAAGVLARPHAPPDPLQQATADGCERDDATLHTLQSPNWVYVNDKDYPATGPAPPFKTVSGVVQRDPLDVHTSGGDNPVSHAAYDLNFDVSVDSADADLVAKTNTSGGLHVEREEAAVPTYVWPEPGDRVTMRGSWVWDCDHFTAGSGEITGEETELHPWTALWVERAQSARSRTGEREVDLYLSSDKTEAGKSADCAHRTKHSQALFKACILVEPRYADVSGRYDYTLPIAGRVRVVDLGSRSAPPLRIAGRHVSFVVPVDKRLPDRLVVAKQIFVQPKRKAPALDHLRVTFDSVLIRRAMDPACIPSAPAGCGTPQTTRDDQVSHGPNGEWNFYADVAGVWSAWTPRVWRVRDGQTIHPAKRVDVWVPRAAPWRLLVWTRECDWGTLARAGSGALEPCPKQAETGNRGGDDVPGAVLKRFRSAAASLGTRTLNAGIAGSTCPAVNRKGCYSVTFTVRRIGR